MSWDHFFDVLPATKAMLSNNKLIAIVFAIIRIFRYLQIHAVKKYSVTSTLAVNLYRPLSP